MKKIKNPEELIRREKLIKAFKAVMPAVGKGDGPLKGTDAFTISPWLIQTYNDHLSISYPFETGVSATVKAAELIKVLDKMGGIHVEITVDEKSLTITDYKTTLAMKLMESGTFQLIQALDLEGLEWNNLPKDFIPALKMSIPSTSSKPSDGLLTGIMIDGTDIISSDNYRAGWAVISKPMGRFVLPKVAANGLLKVPELEGWAASKSWVHFQNNDGAIFSSRLMSNNYPVDGIKQLFPKDDGEWHELPEELIPALERASVMSSYTMSDDGIVDFISIAGENGKIIISSERESGSITEEIEADNAIPLGIKVMINPSFLLDVMTKITRKFRIKGNILIFGDKSFTHLTSTVG